MGILLFATGKVGHGQGRPFTENEKRVKGCGNVAVTNNKITVTGTAPAIGSTYLNGFLRLQGNNVIVAKNKGLLLTKTQPGSSLVINDKTRIKGKLYSAIKKEPAVKRNIYFTSDKAPN